eukprot:gene3270-4120_t
MASEDSNVPEAEPQPIKYELVVTVSEAHNLQNKDEAKGLTNYFKSKPTNLSDPFAIIKCGSFRQKTSTIRDSLDPVWNFEMRFPIYKLDEVPQTLYLECFDEDPNDNEFLGCACIPLPEAIQEMKGPYEQGGWYNLVELGDPSLEPPPVRRKRRPAPVVARGPTLSRAKAIVDEDESETPLPMKLPDQTPDKDAPLGNVRLVLKLDPALPEPEPDPLEEAAEELGEDQTPYGKKFMVDRESLGKAPLGDYTVRVNILEVNNLVGKDSSGTSDPFVRVVCNGDVKQTETLKATSSGIYNELFTFNIEVANLSDLEVGKVFVQVLDANRLFSNEPIGSFEVELGGVYATPKHELWRQWFALTNSFGKGEGGVQGFLKASFVVLGPEDEQQVHDEDQEEKADRLAAAAGVHNVYCMNPDVDVKQYALQKPKRSSKGEFIHQLPLELPMETAYSVQMELYNAFGVPTTSSEVTAKVSFGSVEASFSPRPVHMQSFKQAGANIMFLESIMTKPTFLPDDITQVPDVFVEIWDNGSSPITGKRVVCWGRFSPESLTGEIQWMKFNAGPGATSSGVPVWVNLRATLFVLNVDRAEGLPEMDSATMNAVGKAADAFVAVCFGNPTEVVTEVVNSQSPKWNERLVLPATLPSLSNTIRVRVMDFDSISQHDLIGQLTLRFDDVLAGGLQLKVPEALTVRRERSGGTQGDDAEATEGAFPEGGGLPLALPSFRNYLFRYAVYQAQHLPSTSNEEFADPYCVLTGSSPASFELFPADEVTGLYPVPRPLTLPPTMLCLLELTVIGLRGPLKPYCGLSISKPSVRITIGSMSDPLRVAETKPSDEPTGQSPNFFQVLSMSIPVHTLSAFAPTLRCDVLDHRLTGAVCVGTAFVPLSAYLPWEVAARELAESSGGEEEEEEEEEEVINLEPGTHPRLSTAPWCLPNCGEVRPLLASLETTVYDISGTADDENEEAASSSAKKRRRRKKKNYGSMASQEREISEPLLSSTTGEVVLDMPPHQEAAQGTELATARGAADADDSEGANDSAKQTEKLMEQMDTWRVGRKVYNDALEKHMDLEPFGKFAVLRHQESVGYLKGTIKMTVLDDSAVKAAQAKAEEETPAPAEIPKASAEEAAIARTLHAAQSAEMRRLMMPNAYVARLYVIRTRNIVAPGKVTLGPKHNGLHCYLKVKIGGQTLSFRDDLVYDSLQPQFRKCIELPVMLPGVSVVQIEVWHHDSLYRDVLVGQTELDLENRLFSKEWRESGEALLDLSGLFRTAFVKHRAPLLSKGEASFNYRMIYAAELPVAQARLKLQAWDQDLLNSNDYIGAGLTGHMAMVHWPKRQNKPVNTANDKTGAAPEEEKEEEEEENSCMSDVYQIGGDITEGNVGQGCAGCFCLIFDTLFGCIARIFCPSWRYSTDNQSGDGRQWVVMKDRNGDYMGEVEIQMVVMHDDVARKYEAGSARNEPNKHPHLPKPTRVQWSIFRPDLIIYDILGPELYYQFMAVFTSLTLVFFLFNCLPILATLFTTAEIMADEEDEINNHYYT